MSTLAYTNRLTVVTCCACHIDFAMPNDLYTTRRADHKNFWCPAGHSQYFSGKSDVEKEREAREAAERLAERRLSAMYAARDQADAAERRRRAAKGQLTKVR